MNDTDTTSSVVEKVGPLAMRAVARFWLDTNLPAPLAIRRPIRCPDAPRAVPIDVTVDDMEAWLEATSAVYLGTETALLEGSRVARVGHLGSVPSPIGDVMVLIRIVQRVDAPPPTQPLRLVGGASA